MTNSRRTFLIESTAAAAMLQAQAAAGESKPNDIFQAAAAGDVPRATELADADPTVVRQRSADGRTPLHFATAAGKPGMVMFLSSRGAELSAGPESPLLAAIDYPVHEIAAEMAASLLVNASDPNARRADGKTALQLALSREYEDIAELLIHRGAVVPADFPGMAGIDRVYFNRRYLYDMDGKPVSRDDTKGLSWTSINHFVTPAHFDFEKVKQMYKATPDLLSTRASWDELAIEAAAHTGQYEMALWLAEKGSPVSTCTAVLLGLTDRVKEALKDDPKVIHERGAHDSAILAFAAFGHEQAPIAELLLKAGANVQARAFGVTPLHVAAMKGQIDLAGVLLDHGADVNLAVKSRGEMVTPLAIAVRAKQEKMAAFLRARAERF